MGLLDDMQKRLPNLKWLRRAISDVQEMQQENYRENAEKQRIIYTYGKEYYKRDQLWKKIKDQKKKESVEAWEQRLAKKGFSPQGVYLATGERHKARPFTYDEVSGVVERRFEAELSEKWGKILSLYPRPTTVRTLPVQGKSTSFTVEVKENDLLITPKDKPTFALDKENCSPLYKLYLRKKNGEKIYREAENVTRYQTYWFALFNDLESHS